MIVGSEHFFASPSSFNDPFDCRPLYRFNGTEEQVRAYLDRLFRRKEPSLSSAERGAEIDAILGDPSRDPRNSDNIAIHGALMSVWGTDRLGVLCLSAAPDVPLLWSHYASAHTGVCLGFDPSVGYFAEAQPVRYTRRRPIVDHSVHGRDEITEATLFTKGLDWAYEEEWRIVMLDGPGKHKCVGTPLRSIVLGANIEHDQLKEVLSLARAYSVPVEIFRAIASASSFEVELQPFR